MTLALSGVGDEQLGSLAGEDTYGDGSDGVINDEVLRLLRCPVCAAGMSAPASEVLRCPAGHAFDIARHGYVNLLTGRAPAGADTPEMVAARAELLTDGHLAPVTTAVVDAVPPDVRVVLDAGAGTGHYLAAVLDARPGSVGIAVDVSKAAARRSARAHERLASVVADVWRGLPVADGCVDAVLDIFAPRNAAQFHRVLRPGGCLVVVTPAPEHLGELVAPLGLVRVDPAKADRLAASLQPWFEPVARSSQTYRLELSRAQAARFVTMGPSAWHVDLDRLASQLAEWPEPIGATVAVELTVSRRRDRPINAPSPDLPAVPPATGTDDEHRLDRSDG